MEALAEYEMATNRDQYKSQRHERISAPEFDLLQHPDPGQGRKAIQRQSYKKNYQGARVEKTTTLVHIRSAELEQDLPDSDTQYTKYDDEIGHLTLLQRWRPNEIRRLCSVRWSTLVITCRKKPRINCTPITLGRVDSMHVVAYVGTSEWVI